MPTNPEQGVPRYQRLTGWSLAGRLFVVALGLALLAIMWRGRALQVRAEPLDEAGGGPGSLFAAAPQACLVLDCLDNYEPDDTATQATLLSVDGTVQQHTFHVPTPRDIDWYVIEAEAGIRYTVATSGLLSPTDTIMELYDSDATSLLALNDDCSSGSLASCITWRAEKDGSLYFKVSDFNGGGYCYAYTISGQAGPRPVSQFVPMVVAPIPATSFPITIEIPGLDRPKAVAVDSSSHRVYVTSGDNDELYTFDGSSLSVIGHTSVGDEPWSVAVNPDNHRVFVANFASGDVSVVDGTTLEVLALVPVGMAELSQITIDTLADKVFVTSHAQNAVAVIDSTTYEFSVVNSDGEGPWGIAADSGLNRVYVSNRNDNSIATLAGKRDYTTDPDFRIGNACGDTLGASPFGLAFNSVGAGRNLYVACALPDHGVDYVVLHKATQDGLMYRGSVQVGEGGFDGGGGIAINTTTGNAFVTNSAANTVSVIDGVYYDVVATVPTGADPFGAAADSGTGRVFIVNRGGDSITVLLDTYSP